VRLEKKASGKSGAVQVAVRVIVDTWEDVSVVVPLRRF
jgi:hypothetical protein